MTTPPEVTNTVELPRVIARAVIDACEADMNLTGPHQADVADFFQKLAQAIDEAQGSVGDEESELEAVDFTINVRGGELP